MMIASLLITYYLGSWVGLEVMACKSKDTTTPPPPVCTEGDTITDDDSVKNKQQTKKDAKLVVPSTVYVEVMVAIDDKLYDKIGRGYKNGEWISSFNHPNDDAEVYLYARKFLSAVNIKFQSQFENPKIKFVLREAFKTRTCVFKVIQTPWSLGIVQVLHH